jgi:hypothetical protein
MTEPTTYTLAMVREIEARAYAKGQAEARASLNVDVLARALDLCGIGPIDGHLPSTWAENIAAEYSAILAETERPYYCGGPQTGQPRPHAACNCTRYDPQGERPL